MHVSKIFLIPCFLLLLAGCGLPTAYYLYEPGTTIATPVGNPKFTITNTGENDIDEFKGYELYYRFYTTSAFTSTVESTVSSLTSVSSLTAYGFKPVCSSTRDSYDTSITHKLPLISVSSADRASVFNITADFSLVTTGDIAPVYNTTTMSFNLRRYAKNTQSSFSTDNLKSFYTSGDSTYAYQVGDTDMITAAMTTAQLYSQAVLIMYAVSVGYFDSGYQYSTPTFLGYVYYDITVKD